MGTATTLDSAGGANSSRRRRRGAARAAAASSSPLGAASFFEVDHDASRGAVFFPNNPGAGEGQGGELEIVLAPSQASKGSHRNVTSKPAPVELVPGGIVLGVRADDGEATSRLDVALGALQCSRFLCCSRNKIYWMTPEWGSRSADLPPETQFVLAQLRSINGTSAAPPTFVCLVPLIDSGSFRATLRPPPSNSSSSSFSYSPDDLCLRIESGSPLVKASAFENALLVAAGTDPLALADAAVAAAAALSGAARPRASKRVPDFVDLFGWCTWDAFYSSVSARGVSDGLASLREAGAPPPGFLIIDDGWQVTSLDSGPLLEKHHAAVTPAEAARADAELGVLLQGGAQAGAGAESGLLGPMANAAAVEAIVEKEAAEAAAAEEKQGGDEKESNNIHHRAALAHLPPAAGAAAAPTSPPPLAPPPPPSKAKALAASASGWAKGKAELALASVYGRLVERAPPGSLGHRAFGALVASGDPGAWGERLLTKSVVADEDGGGEGEGAQATSQIKKAKKKKKDGPLRPALLDFYAATSDHVRRLASFRANEKFSRPGAGPAEPMRPGPPEGLASVVADVRERFGVRRVLAWHALHGYWGGIAPEGGDFSFDAADKAADRAAAGNSNNGRGEAAAAPSFSSLSSSPSSCSTALVWPVPTPGVLDVDPPYAWSPQCLSGVGLARDPAALFRGLHGYLKASGIDGVKVDAQATLGMIGGGAVPAPCAGSISSSSSSSSPSSPSSDLALVGGPSLSASYHAALEASIASHFPGNAAINCMCHSTENVFNFAQSAVARTSDDFWPRDPASHRAHVAVNAFNAVFFSPLVLPDWDMFHSRHPAARLHALARVVSGGPVYVSDAPGNHDAALLRRLALPDGRVLRPALPGRPTADCLFSDVMRDGRSLLKVSTVNSTAVAAAAAEVVGGKGEEEELEDDDDDDDEVEVVGNGGAAAAAAATGAAAAERRASYSCGVVGVFNTQGAAWSRRTRRFELLETEENERKKEKKSTGGGGCAPDAGIASWFRNRLLPLCGVGSGGGGDERKRTESEEEGGGGDDGDSSSEVLSTTVSPADVTPRLRTPPSGAFIAWSDEQQTATLVAAPAPQGRRKKSSSASAAAAATAPPAVVVAAASASAASAASAAATTTTAANSESLTVSLPRGGAELISFSPVLLLLQGKSAATLVRAAVVGLAGMANAGGAVLSVSPSPSGPTTRSVAVALRGSGALTLWCEASPSSATVDGKSLDKSAISWDAESMLARVQVPAREGKEEGGFEPDAEVEVFF